MSWATNQPPWKDEDLSDGRWIQLIADGKWILKVFAHENTWASLSIPQAKISSSGKKSSKKHNVDQSQALSGVNGLDGEHHAPFFRLNVCL